MRTKEAILKQIKEDIFLEDFSGFLTDREIAIAAIKRVPENFKYFTMFQNDKEIIKDIVVPASTYHLKHMSNDLKDDTLFALELTKINKLSLKYFSPQVQLSQDVLDFIVKDKYFYSTEIYARYLFENHKETFIDFFTKDHLLYNRLPISLRNNKELVLIRYKNHEVTPNEFFKLNAELQEDFDINLSFLKKMSEYNRYFNKIVKNLKSHMKNNTNLKVFLEEYTRPLYYNIFEILMENAKFKKEIDERYSPYPILDDYRTLLREIDLVDKTLNKDTNMTKNYKRVKI